MNITHETIAKELNLARSTVTRILNDDPTYRASQKTRRKVLALARQMNYDFANLRRIHRRRYQRIPVDIPVYVRILLSDGTVFDEGKARFLDLSPISALVGNFNLHKQLIPLSPFTLEMEVLEGELAAVRVRGRIARIVMPDEMQMGVEFADLEQATIERLKEYLHVS